MISNDILKKQIIELIKSLLTNYFNIISEEEIRIIIDINDNMDSYSYDVMSQRLEKILKNVWDKELSSGKYRIISWNKYSKPKEKSIITFATLSYNDDIIPFCNLDEGIEYKISYDSIIGASPKDGATLIEDKSKIGKYTIGIVGNKVINSYNHSTRLITPKQLLDLSENNYYSKYNELILDTKLIEEIKQVVISQI